MLCNSEKISRVPETLDVAPIFHRSTRFCITYNYDFYDSHVYYYYTQYFWVNLKAPFANLITSIYTWLQALLSSQTMRRALAELFGKTTSTEFNAWYYNRRGAMNSSTKNGLKGALESNSSCSPQTEKPGLWFLY